MISTVNLDLLRRYADHQQFQAIVDYCSECDLAAHPELLPLLGLAQCHLGMGALLEQTLAMIGRVRLTLDSAARTDLAALHIARGELLDAQQILSEVLAEDSAHGMALARLAQCHFLQGDEVTAFELANRAVEQLPQRLPLQLFVIRLGLSLGHLSDLQSRLDTVLGALLAHQPELPDFLYAQYREQGIGQQLMLWIKAGEWARAEDWLELREKDLPETEFLSWVGLCAGVLAEVDDHASATDLLKKYTGDYPESLALTLQLAELLRLQGLAGQAVQMLRRHIQREPGSIALRTKLVDICAHQYAALAREHAEKALELAESDTETPQLHRLQALDALAMVERNEGHFARSLELYTQVLNEAPDFLPSLQGLGQQYLQQGDIDRAVECFERVKKLDPVKGYSALINARQFPDDDATLEKLEQAANRPSLEGSVRTGILFQLAAAWEKKKDYARAFDCATRANKASGRFLAYSPEQHRNDCARIRYCFGPELYKHRPECGVDSTLPVYVVGMPRSGTTLVEQILSGHSSIHGAGELGVIPQLIAGINRWERHTGSGRRYPDCVDDLTPYVTEGFANRVLEELRECEPSASHIVDKLPHNFEHIGLIKFLFPNARIISVRRDPRDIAVSNYFTDYQAKHGGMGFAYDLTAIGEQLADHNLLMHHWHSVFPGEILEVQYEDLIEDLEGNARRMLDYIGVEWEEEVLAFNELDRPVKTASVWQVRQPLYKTSKAKWERYKAYLGPLIKGTNARIEPDPIKDVITLPEPGLLTGGVDAYRDDRLDDAELSFKKMLHHIPDHASANFMLGLVYARKGYLSDGVSLMEKGFKRCPWKKEWRDDLVQAYELLGDTERAEEIRAKPVRRPAGPSQAGDMMPDVKSSTADSGNAIGAGKYV